MDDKEIIDEIKRRSEIAWRKVLAAIIENWLFDTPIPKEFDLEEQKSIMEEKA